MKRKMMYEIDNFIIKFNFTKSKYIEKIHKKGTIGLYNCCNKNTDNKIALNLNIFTSIFPKSF